MENSENDTHFTNILALATEKKLSWEMVHSILCDEMALTFEETKQLVKVLLKELQTMQIKLGQKPIEDQQSQNESSEREAMIGNETFVNEPKLVNDPLKMTEDNFPNERVLEKDVIESGNNLISKETFNHKTAKMYTFVDNTEEFYHEFSNDDIEVNIDPEHQAKEDGQIESVDTKDALECKICLTSFSISTD